MNVEIGDKFYISENYANLQRGELVAVVDITDISLCVKRLDAVRDSVDITWCVLEDMLIDANTVMHRVVVEKRNGKQTDMDVMGLCNVESRIRNFIAEVVWCFAPEPGVMVYKICEENPVKFVSVFARLDA